MKNLKGLEKCPICGEIFLECDYTPCCGCRDCLNCVKSEEYRFRSN